VMQLWHLKVIQELSITTSLDPFLSVIYFIQKKSTHLSRMLVPWKAPGAENLVTLLCGDLNIRASDKKRIGHTSYEADSSPHDDEQGISGRITEPDFFCAELGILGQKGGGDSRARLHVTLSNV